MFRRKGLFLSKIYLNSFTFPLKKSFVLKFGCGPINDSIELARVNCGLVFPPINSRGERTVRVEMNSQFWSKTTNLFFFKVVRGGSASSLYSISRWKPNFNRYISHKILLLYLFCPILSFIDVDIALWHFYYFNLWTTSLAAYVI